MYRRFEASLGMTAFGHFNSAVRVDSEFLVGANLDLEDLLGLDESTSAARLDASYAFSPRHRVDLSIFDIQRDGSSTIGKDVQVGEVLIPAGDVATAFDTLVVKGVYRYNFVADARTAIGASIGLYTMGIRFAMDSQDFNLSESLRVTAPLPVIGLHGEYALSEKWKLLASTEFFQLHLSNFDGFMADAQLALEHDLFDHLGWGVSLNNFILNAAVENSPLSADVEYAYQGIFVYLRGYL